MIKKAYDLELCPSVCPSFDTFVMRAKEQLDFDYLPDFGDFEHEACMILAEVYSLAPDSLLKISGSMKPAHIAQGVFAKLTPEHLQMVRDNFMRIDYPVYNKKLYLRTALYNSVFEISAHYDNLVRVDGLIPTTTLASKWQK